MTGKSLETLILRRPDDWHLHLRDGAMLEAVAPASARLGCAIIMPNLVPPVVTGADAAAYRDRIRAALPANATLTPLMTLYLTEATDPADVVAAHRAGIIAAVKEVGLKVPLVVRLEGTNVDLGKKIINESGLDVIAADDLSDAAQKIVKAVKG